MTYKRYNNPRVRVAAVIIEGDKILLIAHKKKGNIYWLLPGGGVKYGESLINALKRELNEELKVDVKVDDVALISDSIEPNRGRHIINVCFNCSEISGKYSLKKDRRLENFGFFSIKELQNLQIFPPINNELKTIVENRKNDKIYLGERWMNL